MEPFTKRQRVSFDFTDVYKQPKETRQKKVQGNLDNDFNSDAVLQVRRARLDYKLKSTFETIFEKYGKDFDGVGDEIDLMTGEIVVNNGHIHQMQHERDAGGMVSSDPATDDWDARSDSEDVDEDSRLEDAEDGDEASGLGGGDLLEDDMILRGFSHASRFIYHSLPAEREISADDVIEALQALNDVAPLSIPTTADELNSESGTLSRRGAKQRDGLDDTTVEPAWRAPPIMSNLLKDVASQEPGRQSELKRSTSPGYSIWAAVDADGRLDKGPRHRTDFTAEDDALLLDFVAQVRQQGLDLWAHGTWKILAAKYPHHLYTVWRRRYQNKHYNPADGDMVKTKKSRYDTTVARSAITGPAAIDGNEQGSESTPIGPNRQHALLRHSTSPPNTKDVAVGNSTGNEIADVSILGSSVLFDSKPCLHEACSSATKQYRLNRHVNEELSPMDLHCLQVHKTTPYPCRETGCVYTGPLGFGMQLELIRHVKLTHYSLGALGRLRGRVHDAYLDAVLGAPDQKGSSDAIGHAAQEPPKEVDMPAAEPLQDVDDLVKYKELPTVGISGNDMIDDVLPTPEVQPPISPKQVRPSAHNFSLSSQYIGKTSTYKTISENGNEVLLDNHRQRRIVNSDPQPEVAIPGVDVDLDPLNNNIKQEQSSPYQYTNMDENINLHMFEPPMGDRSNATERSLPSVSKKPSFITPYRKTKRKSRSSTLKQVIGSDDVDELSPCADDFIYIYPRPRSGARHSSSVQTRIKREDIDGDASAAFRAKKRKFVSLLDDEEDELAINEQFSTPKPTRRRKSAPGVKKEPDVPDEHISAEDQIALLPLTSVDTEDVPAS
ncbi:hypothetical protein BJ878DRAFT_510948 [Calycina marina]|uniref:TERF2-interacting telomeric protein 1 Myb domain-containing protein n=1 Tax=Calycina marina TaxID=1763456 RepID=A0A9P7Z0M5_9HELO|nr:hypothetical protein BJ878DRAFT_510948 [Calycina marina]